MTLKLGMQHWWLQPYQVCPNDDPWLALNVLWHLGQIWSPRLGEKGETMDFSDFIVACDIKVDSCNQQNRH